MLTKAEMKYLLKEMKKHIAESTRKMAWNKHIF